MTVLVVVTTADEAEPLVRWGARFARAREAPLAVLHPARGSKPGELEVHALATDADAHPTRQAIRRAIREVQAWADPTQPPQQVCPQCHGTVDLAGPLPARCAECAALYHEPCAEALEAERCAVRECQGQVAPLTEPPPSAAPSPAVPAIALYGVSHPEPPAAVLAAVSSLRAGLLVVGKHEKLTREEAAQDLSVRLMSDAPCDTMLLRATPASGRRADRILVPASGGPHAPIALRLGQALAVREEGTVVPLYVQAPGDELAEEVGKRQLGRILTDAGVAAASPRVQAKAVLADSPTAGIRAEAAHGYDLVLVGASNEGFVRRLLFRTVPDKLLSGPDATAVAVVRRGTPLATRAWRKLEELSARYFPQLEREDRIALFERLEGGSRFDIDFMALLSMATAIAAFGLLQNSGAVVIGAMLVAPLMTPMVGMGLGLVQGNMILVREAFVSVLKGFLLALAIGFGVGLVFGRMATGPDLNDQLLARGFPNLLDLFVAFVSGLAAAYAIARPNLSGALPGVAIAAALVPPVATVGIAAAMGAFGVSRGAALLFGTNLVAIVLGAAATFRIVGVHASREQGARLWVRRVLLALVVALCALTVPLVSALVSAVAPGDASRIVVTDRLRVAIERRVEQDPALTYVTVETSRAGPELEVLVAARGAPPADLADHLAIAAREVVGRPVQVHVIAIPAEWQGSGE